MIKSAVCDPDRTFTCPNCRGNSLSTTCPVCYRTGKIPLWWHVQLSLHPSTVWWNLCLRLDKTLCQPPQSPQPWAPADPYPWGRAIGFSYLSGPHTHRTTTVCPSPGAFAHV